MILRIRFLIISLFFAGFTAQGQQQKSITHQQLYWVRYFEKIKLSPKWTIDAEIEDRRFFTNNQQHQWLLPRIQVAYSYSAGLTMSAGAVYFLQELPHEPEADSFSRNLEIRPHQMLTWNIKNKRSSWKHRYWLEERFYNRSADDEDPWDFNFRFRYLLQYTYQLAKPKRGPAIDVFLFDEIMLNAGREIVNNTFDQNRIGGGIKFKWTPTFNTTLSYINWYQQRSSGNRYFLRHIARLSIQHRLDFSKIE